MVGGELVVVSRKVAPRLHLAPAVCVNAGREMVVEKGTYAPLAEAQVTVSLEPSAGVTLYTVPTGRSATTSDLNVGAAADPLVGPQSAVFAFWLRMVAATVPLPVSAVLGAAESRTPSPTNCTLLTPPPLDPPLATWALATAE